MVALITAIVIGSFTRNKDTLDFSEFYGAAQMVREGYAGRLYDLSLQTEFQSRVAAVHAFYLRPPFETLIFLPFTYVGYRAAYTIWTILNVAVLMLIVFLVVRTTNVGLVLWEYVKIRGDLGLVAVLFLTFVPATTCLLLGQDAVLILLVYSLVFLLLRKKKEFAAGCLLACGLFKFHLIVPFVLILFLRRKWSVIKGLVAVALPLVIISVAISGSQVLREYPRALLFDSASGRRMGFAPEFSPNIRGFLYLITLGKLPGPVFALLIALFSLAAIWLAAKNWRHDEFGLSFSAGVLATALASYHLYNYDLLLLLLPVSIACGELAERGQLRAGGIALIAVLVVLFLPPLHFLLVTHAVYALMFIPIFILFVIVLRLTQSNLPGKIASASSATDGILLSAS